MEEDNDKTAIVVAIGIVGLAILLGGRNTLQTATAIPNREPEEQVLPVCRVTNHIANILVNLTRLHIFGQTLGTKPNPIGLEAVSPEIYRKFDKLHVRIGLNIPLDPGLRLDFTMLVSTDNGVSYLPFQPLIINAGGKFVESDIFLSSIRGFLPGDLLQCEVLPVGIGVYPVTQYIQIDGIYLD